MEKRIAHLLYLRELGYKIGTGIICGLPKQTIDDLVDDILFMKHLKPDMASISRFLPNRQSHFAYKPVGNADLSLNFLSLLRIELPYDDLRIPSGTTLGNSVAQGLIHGANTISFHITPTEYVNLYSADRIESRIATKLDTIHKISEQTGLNIVGID